MVTLSGNRVAANAEDESRSVRIRHLVVPLDGTPLAECAIPPAASLARALNAEVTLVRAYASSSSLPSGSAAVRWHPRANRGDIHQASLYLARLQAGLRSQGIRASSRVVQAHPVEAILEVAAHTPADLVVIATRGTRAGDRLACASVAADSIRHCQVPVLVVTGATANPFAPSDAERICLALAEDDLVRNRPVRDALSAFARAFEAHVAVLRGRRAMATTTMLRAGDVDPVERILADLRAEGVRLCAATASGPTDARTLGAFACEQRADLVIAGRRAMAQPSQNAEYALDVLYQSRVPVLYIP